MINIHINIRKLIVEIQLEASESPLSLCGSLKVMIDGDQKASYTHHLT
jgi:hypothetical protein